MSTCPSTLQLSPSVCLHLLCLLLVPLTACSSSASKIKLVTAEPTTQAHRSTDRDNRGVATDLHQKNDSKGKREDLFPSNSSSSTHAFNDSTVSSINQTSNQQPASTDHQGTSPAPVTQPVVPSPSTTTGLTKQAAHTEPFTSTGTIPSTTTEPVKSVSTTPLLVTSKATITPASTTTTATSRTTTRPSTTEPTSTHPATTAKATTKANETVAIPTTTGTKTSPPPPPPPSAAPPQPNAPSTGMPPVPTSLPRGPTTVTVTSTSATADRNKPVPPGTRVAMVDVAGDALTSQLVDTASLLAVLLFGLLFFLVTVAVFVTQAYESYRRKDYTQVDYLINGMYSDSGV
ncbi:uncharacterized protein C11orf24 [Anoplopoma fimbria]|uniref:uncharacterized protein C11orf24 n=1 Tax=Anoplopoma fimbria TaxID=229290 RepID=UPI0023EB63BB|nr:uncharacterized protein C11orf24 [Anoplopoma fimbria]